MNQTAKQNTDDSDNSESVGVLRHGRKAAMAGPAVAISFLALNLIAQTSLVDPSFNPGTGADGGFVESMVVQPDHKILICGNFTSFNGTPQAYVARLLPNGSVDPAFQAHVGYWVRYMLLQPDDRIVIGGWFTDVEGIPRNRVARLNADGSLDLTFDPGTGCAGKIVEVDPNDPFVFAMALQPDGKIIVGGNFTTYNDLPRNGLVRINSDGSADPTFDVGSGVNSWVRSLRLMPNGQLYVSGWFTEYKNQGHNRMMLLNSDGSVDPGFNPYFGDSTAIYSMSPQQDGKIVVGGHSINPDAPFHQEIIRLNTDGTYDSTFNPGGSGANDKVETTLLQSDGKVIIGGYFNLYNDIGVGGLSRLNSDGSLDPTFAANVDNWIWTALPDGDFGTLICGAFATVDGFPRSGIARLSTNPSPWLQNPRWENGTFRISVGTVSGKSYFLQYKDSLNDAQWASFPAVSGDGTVKTLSDPTASGQARTYRVMQE